MAEHTFYLALDLSLNQTGYAICERVDGKRHSTFDIVEASYIPNRQFDADDYGLKLLHIERRLYVLRDIYRPSIVVKENLATSSHEQAAKLGSVHGIMHKVFNNRADIVGYSPTHIKKVITGGDGKADKLDVQRALIPYVGDICYANDDISDAIAIMYTYLIEQGYVDAKNTPPSA